MNSQLSKQQGKLDKVMTTEQFNQIVEAILAGKYSWACVLILRFAGYNPLHYIPYRTYNRLIKDNYCCARSSSEDRSTTADSNGAVKSLHHIEDLNFADLASQQDSKIKGGLKFPWFFNN
jgi:hypothetical protein